MYKNIKQIYIGNILESYFQSYTSDKLPVSEGDFWRKYDALDNNRSLLYGGDDKILITPLRIDPKQIRHICELAGWKNVHNLVPKKISDCVSLDIITDKLFWELFINIIQNNPGVEIIQYRHTPEFYRLVERLREKDTDLIFPELVPKEDKFIEEYFHSKRGFRHLWEQTKDPRLEIDIPEGYIAGDKKEAIDAAWWFKRQERNFVFKYNRGVQGVGVLLNKAADFPGSKTEFVKQVNKMLEDGIWRESPIVVEEMIDVNKDILGGSPNVEMRIDKYGRVYREYACAQVLDPDGKTFLGVTMNPEVEKNKHIEQAFLAAEIYGQRLSDLGYRGIFDMDLVVSMENELFAVEANLRRTGGTHAHEFCKNILGPDYAKHFWVHLQDVNVTKKNIFTNLLNKYKYNEITKTGIIPVNPDMMAVNKAPILIIAPDKQKLKEILGEVNGV